MMNGVGHVDTCYKKGWMKKQGGLVKNWLDRWFVLKGLQITEYIHRNDMLQFCGFGSINPAAYWYLSQSFLLLNGCFSVIGRCDSALCKLPIY